MGQGVGILALFTLVGLATLRLTTPPFPVMPGVTHRLPELDNRLMSGWLGNDKVVTGIVDTSALISTCTVYRELQEPQEIFDLLDHTRRPTPNLPKLPKNEDGSDSLRRSSPSPSPDGQWLLYDEWASHNNKILFRRWRLIHPDGTGTQILPFPTSAEFLYPHWLTDSSGWIGTDSSVSTGYLTRISSTHLTQTPLSLPENLWHLSVVAGGELVFAPKWRGQPRQIVYKSSSLSTTTLVQKHSLQLPLGTPDLLGYGPSPFEFSRDGRFLIVRAYLPSSDNRFLAWLQQAVPGRDAGYVFWRIPRDGGSPERLPLPGDAVNFSLSPDGKKILYWRDANEAGSQAYLLTLPVR